MTKLARSILVAMLIAAGLVALPRPADRVFSPEAQAQVVPTPTLPPILPGDKDDNDQGGDDGGGGGGGDSDPGDVIDDGDDDPAGGGGGNKPGGDKAGGDKPSRGDDKAKNKKGKRGNRKGRPGGNVFVGDDSRILGSFSTDALVAAASRLRALGMSADEVNAEVYPPFLIAGEAAWSDTWGAPRFGPGSLVRTHEGQDVFCRYGDPVLAPEDGVVSYDSGGLGGITARVHTSTSEYWYMTHLSGTNAREYPAGSPVDTGDVVGFCGNSGNAISTPPHVHFGWYVNGKAKDPMRILIKWLRTAELRVLGKVSKVEAEAVRTSDARLTERLFGDAFAPDLGELTDKAERLLALKLSGDAGFEVLGESFLQAAEASLEDSNVPAQSSVPASPEDVAARELWDEVRTSIRNENAD